MALSMEANLAAQELYAEMIRRTVKDPETAAALVRQRQPLPEIWAGERIADWLR